MSVLHRLTVLSVPLALSSQLYGCRCSAAPEEGAARPNLSQPAESQPAASAPTTPEQQTKPVGNPKPAEHPALDAAETYVTDTLRIRTPHRPQPHQVQGSGHTHCAPDHSEIDAGEQQRRLRALGPLHRHDFVWMTAHNFVAPDPGVEDIHHLFGVEIFTQHLEGRRSPHVVALLPDGSLAGTDKKPFGIYKLDLAKTAAAVARTGGLAVLAHPSRYSPSTESLKEIGTDLWGIEVLSGSTKPEENAAFIDERLSSGRYTCLSAGGDIHREDYKMTTGYQVLDVSKADPKPDEIFAAVKQCNFFACGVRSTRHGPIRRPALRIKNGEVHFSATTVLGSIRFIGRDGKLLHEAHNTTNASYQPRSGDLYVRVEAVSVDKNARCYSQPTWVQQR